jgi:predicted DNA-binding transcriptional regulator YafY
VLVGAAASTQVRSTYATHPPAAVVRPVQEAFVGCRRLDVTYAGAAGPPRRRVIEPHALLFNLPVWYVLGRDVDAGEARTFRLDRLQRARCLEETFVVVAPSTLLAEVDAYFTPV